MFSIKDLSAALKERKKVTGNRNSERISKKEKERDCERTYQRQDLVFFLLMRPSLKASIIETK